MLGLGGFNPKKMQGMMKKLGIEQEEVNAKRVIIERDEGNIVIENPNVQKVSVQGQESFQITGEIKREGEGISEDDVRLVMDKTGKSEEDVRKVLEESEDIAEAIIRLSD